MLKTSTLLAACQTEALYKVSSADSSRDIACPGGLFPVSTSWTDLGNVLRCNEAAHAVGISRPAVTQRMNRVKDEWEEHWADGDELEQGVCA